MLRPNSAKREDGDTKNPGHGSYSRIAMESYERNPRRALLHENRLFLRLRKVLGAGVGLLGFLFVLVAVVMFLFIWNHLFAINAGTMTLEADGGSTHQKTFTVR